MKNFSLFLVAAFLALILTNHPSPNKDAMGKTIYRPAPVDIEYNAERDYQNRPDRWMDAKKQKAFKATPPLEKKSAKYINSKRKGFR